MPCDLQHIPLVPSDHREPSNPASHTNNAFILIWGNRPQPPHQAPWPRPHLKHHETVTLRRATRLAPKWLSATKIRTVCFRSSPFLTSGAQKCGPHQTKEFPP